MSAFICPVFVNNVHPSDYPHSHSTSSSVEDPSPELTALRDYVDCRNALQLPCFQFPLIHQSYSHEIEKECQEKLKINKVHVHVLVQ